jgi:plastocyanin
MDMENGIDLHAFFPAQLTVNAGDTVFWEFVPMGMPGFHTVTFTSGEEIPPLFVPDIVDGTPVASPEGPPRIQFNPMLAFGDGRTEYDGTGPVNSGLDVLRTSDQPPYMLTFTQPGTYEYVCAVHFMVMKGTIVVQEAGSDLPTDAAGVAAQAASERAIYLEEGMTALAAANAKPAMTEDGLAWDVSAGDGGLHPARLMHFYPRELTIKVGDTVRWTDRSIAEPHTVTFLGGTEPPEDVMLEPQASGNPKLIQNFQSFLPVGDAEFHGGGYRNSGFLGLPPEIGEMFGLNGDTYELTFTAPGEYPYYCILHASGPEDETRMTGKIVVEA